VNVSYPLKTMLRDPLDEAMVNRVGRGMRARRIALAKPRLRAGHAWLVVLAVLIALGATVRFARHRALAVPTLLSLADGSKLVELEAGNAAKALWLSDGSELLLATGARLVPVVNASNAVVLRLDAGEVVFDVRPGGPRHWWIEGGLATIDVTGTRFAVSRTEASLRVEVEHGVVVVRGARVAEQMQRLSAGERLVVTDLVTGVDEPTAQGESADVATTALAGSQKTARSAERDRSPSAIARSDAARRVTALLASADKARAEGHPEQAVEALREITQRFRSDPRAGAAAFTLGKLQMDRLGDPQGAARSFELAIGHGLPATLLEDAYARLVEAHARAGNRLAAERATEMYLARFPNGSREPAMKRWILQP
jgi:transmembrane sensor